MRYLGLDVGKRYIQACLLDEDGLEDISLLLDPDDMESFKTRREAVESALPNLIA